MKHKIVLFIIAIMAITALACKPAEEKVSEEKPVENSYKTSPMKLNEESPTFTLKDVNGKEIKLTDYKGKIVILDFWATWCGPCRRGVPDLVELQKEFKNDVAVLGISLDWLTGTSADVADFIKEYEINYPILIADEQVTKDFGGIAAIPTSFVLDKQGNIVDQHVGLVSKSVFTNKIKELLAN